MTDSSRQEPLSEGWSTRQLADFLTLISSFDDERSATIHLVERAVEVLEADAVALVEGQHLVVSAGPRASLLAAAEVRAVASGRRSSLLLGAESVPALGAEAGEHNSRVLVVVRAEPEFV